MFHLLHESFEAEHAHHSHTADIPAARSQKSFQEKWFYAGGLNPQAWEPSLQQQTYKTLTSVSVLTSLWALQVYILLVIHAVIYGSSWRTSLEHA